jgi:hypothetical protein
MNPRVFATVCLLLGVISPAFGQGSAGTGGRLEPRYLIDLPTAGMLQKGSYAVDVDFYQQGGVLVGLSAGLFQRFSIGLSYGGSRLIGNETPEMNDVPGVNVRVRVLEESMFIPALVLGFDSQGRDGLIPGANRYVIKSPGLFGVISKNYSFMGYLSLHGGVNYSFERSDGDRDINVFGGVEKTLGPFLSLILEYNPALNDNSENAVGKGRGYVNAAVKCTFGSGVTLGVNFKDLARNGGGSTTAIRTVHIEFVHSF